MQLDQVRLGGHHDLTTAPASLHTKSNPVVTDDVKCTGVSGVTEAACGAMAGSATAAVMFTNNRCCLSAPRTMRGPDRGDHATA